MSNNPGQGRKPKPTHLKLLEGDIHKGRINHDEPKPYPKAPKCPAWLGKEAKREWKRLTPQLERLGVLTEIDMAEFAGYCVAVGNFEWSQKQIKKLQRAERAELLVGGEKIKDTPLLGGLIIQNESKLGWTITAYASLANKSLEQIRSFGSEFGLSPSSRTRIKTADLGDEDDPLFTK